MNQDTFCLLSVPLESCVFQEGYKLKVHSDYAGKGYMAMGVSHHNKIKYVDLKMKMKKHEELFLA